MPDSAGHEPSQASSPHGNNKNESTRELVVGILAAFSGLVSMLVAIQNFLNGSHVRQSFGAGLVTVVLVVVASFFLARRKGEHGPLSNRSNVVSAIVALLLVAGGVTLFAMPEPSQGQLVSPPLTLSFSPSATMVRTSPAYSGTSSPTDTVYYSGTLTYDGRSGGKSYDLDYSPPAVFGPNNTLNLLENEIDVIVSNGAKAAPSWTAASLPGKPQCVNALAQASGDFSGIYQGLTVGTTFCFQTAAGRYGAVRVIDASAHYAVSVAVWS